ncbi:MAG: response regulator [Elusimicrobia bacterium]|nr:response regulator [Elusimicrobiota bacterium]
MKERILLVENDQGLLAFCCYLLSREKYAVTVCSSAAEAAALIRGGAYDILLTDFHLGDGCGADLLSLSKRVAPAARALLMSADDTRHAALRKPFTSQELLSAVAC